MKFILLFVGLFLFLYTNSISAQTSNDTIIAWQYYQKADSLLQARKMDSSIVYFKKALPIYEHAKEWERLMDCYNKISRNYIRKGEYNESISFAKLAIEITEKHFNKNIIQSAVAYNNLGESYESDFNYAEAEKSYKKSVEIKQNLLGDDDIALAYSYDKLGVLYYHISKYDESLTLLKQSLAIYLKFPDKALDKISRNYNNIGNVYDALGKFDKCIFYYEESIKINQKDSANRPIRLAHNYINIGGTYHQINNLDKALLYYNKARVIAEMKEYDRGLLGIYGNMGLSFLNKGEFNKSLEFQKKSLDIALRTLDKNNPYIGTIYISLGDAYGAIGDLETKISYYEKGLLTYQSVFEENHYLIADTYLFLGNLHINRKDYDASDLYFKKALKIYNHLFEEGHPKISEVYLRKGDMYYEQKNYELAIKNYEMGIANLEKAYGKSTLLSAEYHNKIAKIYQIQEQFDKALDNFDKAIQANSNNKNISDISFENSFDRLFILESLIGKGKIFYSLSKKEEAKNHLSNSIKNYKFADDVIDQMRSTYRDYNDKLIFSKKVKEVYQGILEAQLSLFKLEKDQKIVKNILYYTEKNKSSTLKELLNTTTANKFIGLSSAIVELEKSIKTDKAFYQSEIVFEQSQQSDLNNKKIKELESQIFNLNKRQDSLTHIVEKNYPKYYNLKYQNKVISVADIQSKLDEQTTLLEFFTSDSSTYAFTISKNNIDVQELATPDLANKVYGFKQSIISKDLKVYKKYANELYQELISPIASKIKGNQLIIVPDGPLWHLNFDLLLAEQSDANNPKELPYLVKEYIISYANSATLLFDAFKEPKREDVAEECLAFSFTDSTSVEQTKTMSLAALRDTGDDLPGTREEIKAISNIIDGQYYFGSQAIETNFKKNANKYNILHLALHGEVDNERPENSRLFFTKSNDTIEDNFLYSHELFALDIPAELTVLSACNTGSGKIAKGEGIMSLGNAFQYAGTKSLLLTSWEVSDQTTPKLMKYFYTNLKKGMNKAEALQQAKLQYINTADVNRVAPFYWGGFYLVGDPEPIQFANNNWRYWILGIGFSLLLLGLFYFINKKKR